ncbi:MAG: hypothetical protein Q9162_007764 [Coniocarpon cinnabarinum]
MDILVLNNASAATTAMIPNSHKGAVQRYHQKYDQDLASGKYLPFAYPLATFGAAIGLLFFLLVPPTSSLHSPFTRYLTFAVIASWHTYLTIYCQGLNPSTGFGVGGIATFGTVWAATLLVFNDAKRDFKRLHRRPRCISAKGDETSKPAINSLINASMHLVEQHSDDSGYAGSQYDYYWQSYPPLLEDRLWWVLDLWSNFRLIGWDHGLDTMPTIPASVQKQLNASSKRDDNIIDRPVTTTGLRRFESRDHLVQHFLWTFIKGYIMLDILCTLVRHDPYFRGDLDAVPTGLPQFMLDWPGLWILGYRLFVGMAFVWLGLRNVLVLAPLLIPTVIDSKLLGTWSEPWLYPDHYGSYTVVFDKGLAGWWGGWWHQSFRCGFLAASDWILSICNIPEHTVSARSISVLTAFFISGLIHAAGSLTLVGETQPWAPTAFFMIQPVGIIAEISWRRLLARYGLRHRIPAWLGYLANFVWVHLWFWYTAPMFVDDMAKGGLWLGQMLPMSPARALGLGEKGDSLWCWEGPWAEWHKGNPWWTSGLAF